MARLLLMGVVLLAGCAGTEGPRQRFYGPPVKIDDPRLTIPEQKARGREYLALPQESPSVAPRTFAEPPGYWNRRD